MKQNNEIPQNYVERGYAFSGRNAIILGLEKAIILNTLGPILEFEKKYPCPDGNMIPEECHSMFPFIKEKKFHKLIKEMIKDGFFS